MRELFVEKVIDTTEDFLDNNQRIKLKEIRWKTGTEEKGSLKDGFFQITV